MMLLASACLLATALSQFCVGPSGIAPAALFGAFIDPQSADRFLVFTLGLPRYIVGLLAGAALGASGAIFQNVTRNPLASPDVLGFGAGAATGAIGALLLNLQTRTSTAAMAAVGGLLSATLVYTLAGGRRCAPRQLILTGIMVSALLSAVNGYLLLNIDAQDTQVVLAWLSGSLNAASWQDVPVFAAVSAALVTLSVLLHRSFHLLAFDDERVMTLGGRPDAHRALWIVLGVLLVAITTATTGPIAFVALAAPHIARRFNQGRLSNVLIPAVIGAILVTACDAIAANALPIHPPVGIVTGALGGLYLLSLLVRFDSRGVHAQPR